MDKTALRRHFRSYRESLSALEVAAASSAICQRLAAWPVLRESHTVLTYLAFRNELDLGQLFKLLPRIRWIVPRIEKDQLVLHPYDPTHLVRHALGMLEPTAEQPIVPGAELDAVLVPGVAFDRQGGRLGFGGGYYDRLLPNTPALRVGITYDCCLAGQLPRHTHDQPMDWVITPTQTIHCTPFWSGK
ncbi:MAG: 5-formyltetrahydrofolate cyclo-ligase [Anaerolineae bacterium]|nr:5-formyltetrahydrofolate cyclo-ligase [Anaerolineae bacterium]